MSIVIINNFLEEHNFVKLQDVMLGGWFPWFFNNGIISLDSKIIDKLDIYDFQFTHNFVHNEQVVSDSIKYLQSFIHRLGAKQIIRLKSNFLVPTFEQVQTRFHTDLEETAGKKTGVFYLNTNNGFTVFEDGTRIPSIANRFVVFDANMPHAGTTCTDQKSRCLLNVNFVDK